MGIGGAELTIYRPSLTASLAWSGAGTNVVWRWQATDRPFPAEASLTPPGLLASGTVTTGSFAVYFGAFPPLGQPVRRLSRPAPPPARGGDVGPRHAFGRGGAHLLRPHSSGAERPGGRRAIEHRGSRTSCRAPTRASRNRATPSWPRPQRRKGRRTDLAARQVYHTSIVSFKPAVFADPNFWGCVTILKNPYVKQITKQANGP